MNKKMTNLLILPAIFSMLLSGCGKGAKPLKNITSSDTLYVKKVDNLKNDFMFGMDASSVPSLEKGGVKFYDFDGSEKDVFEILAKYGFTDIRVRVWNDPFDAQGRGYGGGNCDINTALEIGKRATKYGMGLIVDFHLSDFWADPAKYQAPKAWKNMDAREKGDAAYKYAKESLQLLKDNKVKVSMVQCGNETNNGIAGETTWMNRYMLMAGVSKATREVYKNAKVAVHFANPENVKNYRTYAEKLAYYELDYDVFGTSYYPYWHGTLENLSTILSEIATTYNKKVAVLETSYANTEEDTDFYGNTISQNMGYDYPFTIAGQSNHIRNLTDTIVNKTTNGIGVCYWEGTWIAAGGNSWEENVPLWRDNGSGWTSEYSASYESDDAGYNGGSAVDNQCFFDKDGKALESLKVWGMMGEGNDAPLYVDGVDNPTDTFYTDNYNYQLPATVNLVYNDNSRQPKPVVWETFDLEAARAAGNATYYIKGRSEGFDVTLTLNVMEYNFLEDYSFEGKNKDVWKYTVMNESSLGDNYKVGMIDITKDSVNPKTGSTSFHFWAKDANTAGFDLYQEVTLEQAGTYKYTFNLMGGNGGGAIDQTKQNIYGYVKVNGVEVKTQEAFLKGYSKTYEDGTYIINGITVAAGDKVTVGIHLEANEAGSWGDIDDLMLNMVI